MKQRASSSSLELDIFNLSHYWEAHRTIRNGDTPGQELCKGPRPPLAAIPPNVEAAPAAAAANPFSLNVQRQKAATSRLPGSQQQQQQPSLRFAVDGPADGACTRQQSVDAENMGRAHLVAATPAAMPSAALSKVAGGVGTGCGASCDSPSPYVLFRGRLSFAAEADSARKFDRAAATSQRPGGVGLKRKLLISPGADMSAAFPTLLKPSAKQRRQSLGDAELCWAGCAAAAKTGAEALGGSVAAANRPLAGSAAVAQTSADAAEGSCLGKYWSDSMPLKGGLSAELLAAAGRAVLAAGNDMQNTEASPTSSGLECSSDRCSSLSGIEAYCGCEGSPLLQEASLSPLLGHQQHALPTVEQPDCGFPAITAQTMHDLLAHGAPAFGVSDFVVVDCRYDYEYEGGRLPGAVHLTTPEDIAAFLAQPHGSQQRGGGFSATGDVGGDRWQRTAIIFHCEFSTERGPRAAKWVRNQDREAHLHDYPALSHPHVFVLQGGFKAFWRAFPDLCEGEYRPMDHPQFTEELKACHKVVKQAWAKTTRTYSRKQRQCRPSYCLRQSTSAPCVGGRDGGMRATATDAGDVEAELARSSPA